MLCDSIREHTTIIQKPDSQMAEPYSQMAEVMIQLTSQMTNDKSTDKYSDTNDNQMTEDTRYKIK